MQFIRARKIEKHIPLVCILLQGILVSWIFWQQSVTANHTLRVAAPNLERVSSSLSPYGPGFEEELLTRFARNYGYTIKRITIDTQEEGWLALEENRADVVVGFSGETPNHLHASVTAGPGYDSSRPILVQSARRHGVRHAKDMCQVPILLTSEAELATTLANASTDLNCLPWASTTDDMYVTPILATLHENKARFALLDDKDYSLWQPFFLKVKPSRAFEEKRTYRWFWRKNSSPRASALQAFWEAREKDSVIAELTEKYFGFLPEKVDYYDLWLLSKAVEKNLPRYKNTLTKASARNTIDPLLLTAVIYQESHFDPAAVSRTGVRGLMMITQDTARLLNINRLDPKDSIKGGARYLKQLWERLGEYDLTPWDRWFFALAGYNQGIGHVFDAMKLSQAQGGSGKTWRELKKTLPLLAWKKYYRNTKHGYCRGYEAVTYVENIRYYYYILNGLVSLSRREAEHLSPLLGAIPSSWPII